MNLENKVVVITGGTKGIGYSLAKHLRKEKAKVGLYLKCRRIKANPQMNLM